MALSTPRKDFCESLRLALMTWHPNFFLHQLYDRLGKAPYYPSFLSLLTPSDYFLTWFINSLYGNLRKFPTNPPSQAIPSLITQNCTSSLHQLRDMWGWIMLSLLLYLIIYLPDSGPTNSGTTDGKQIGWMKYTH